MISLFDDLSYYSCRHAGDEHIVQVSLEDHRTVETRVRMEDNDVRVIEFEQVPLEKIP